MHEITLESLAFGGDALGHLDGKVVFVPLGVPGDRVTVRIVDEHASYARGEIVRLLDPGPGRRPPPCPLFGQCGGCHWQHMEYSVQLSGKAEIFSGAMSRAGVPDVLPIGGARAELGYRRRIRMHFERRARGVDLGFFRRRTRELLDVPRCLLLQDALQRAVDLCREALMQLSEGKGSLVAVAGSDGSVHVSIRISSGPPVRLQPLAQAALGDPIVGVAVSRGRQSRTAGVDCVELGPLMASSAAFVQANPAQDLQLREVVQRWADAPFPRVLELFAGIGNLTGVLAASDREVVAVENSSASTALLERNRQHFDGMVTVRRQDAGAALDDLCVGDRRFDLVLLNPPREGCRRVAAQLGRTGARRVIYVSCDPMTLQRDLSLLQGQGFSPLRAVALDMMPQTYHLEGLVLLHRDGDQPDGIEVYSSG